MSGSNDVVRRYAEALAASALQKGELNSVCDDFETVDECFRQEPSLVVRLAMPSLSVKQKIMVLKKAFGDTVIPLTMRFLALAVKRGRVRLLPLMYSAVLQERDRLEQIADVLVTSASRLSDNEKNDLATKIRQQFGAASRISYQEDDSLIAGYRITTNERTIDCSVKSELELLRHQLLRG